MATSTSAEPRRQAEFRAIVRAELERCERRAAEYAGPSRLNELMGLDGGNTLRGDLARIRREELEYGGFVREGAYWVRKYRRLTCDACGGAGTDCLWCDGAGTRLYWISEGGEVVS